MKLYKIFLTLILFSVACNMKNKPDYKEINLNEQVKIIIPILNSHFNDSLVFTHIQVWIDDNQIYTDTTSTEYMFNCIKLPQVKKLVNGEYELLLAVFDAPDFNKIHALYFKDNILIRKNILPFFEDTLTDIDSDSDCKNEYVGIMHAVDAYSNNDSCYYNPHLYYKDTDMGIKLDSNLTIKMNEKKWGKFYGFSNSENVLPCPAQ